jgi:hypothetical protein
MRALLSIPESVGGHLLLTKLLKVFAEFCLDLLETREILDQKSLRTSLAMAYRDLKNPDHGVLWVSAAVDEGSANVNAERFREALAEKFPERVPKPKPAEAPRVTPADIETEIASEHYFTALDGRRGAIDSGAYVGRENPTPNDADLVPLGLVTFCVLVLRNGCKVVGINHGPVDPANFDAEHGRRDAREDAIRQVWPLLGFRLRDKLTATRLEN